MLIILCGSIGRSVTGGQAWANLQYLIGLRELGHEVYYLEDCGNWSEVYDWEKREKTSGLEYPASYVQRSLEPHGLDGRWMYRVGERSMGLGIAEFREVCGAADLLLIRGIPMLKWRTEYALPRRRAYLDIDPGFTQISLVKDDYAFVETIGHSEAVFTYGQRIGLPDCPIPTGGRHWHKTLPPVVLSQWPLAEQAGATAFTSVLRWRGVKDLEHRGLVCGQKDREFPKFIDLPKLTSQPFRLALTGGGRKVCLDNGWEVVPGWKATQTAELYAEFIRQSRAEFSVAKHCYVDARVGWFSDRSVCYLASGRPVLVQDTGLTEQWPSGVGIVTFGNLSEAIGGIEAINGDYEKHRVRAREAAERFFAAQRVLPALLSEAMG